MVMTIQATTVEAKATVAGMHHWPEAPENRAYLRTPHRHLFVARAEVLVVHDDREVEFHDLLDDLTEALTAQRVTEDGWPLYDFGAASCERLAQACFEHLAGAGYPIVMVSVAEDDENTSRVYGEYAPELPTPRTAERRIPEPARVPGQEPLS